MQEEQKNMMQQTADAPEQKKKFSAPMMIGLAAAVVAVIGIGAFAAMHFFFKTPKAAVAQAFLSLVEDLDQTPEEQLFGLREITENVLNGDYKDQLELTVSDLSNEDLALLKGSGLSINQQISHTQKKYGEDLSLNYGSLSLGTLKVYYDQNMLQAALPDYSTRIFQVDLGDGLEEEILDSPILGETDLSQEEKEEMAHYLAVTFNSVSSENLTFGQLWDRFCRSSQAAEDFVNGVQAQKAGKETFTVDGRDVSCAGYQVVIGRDVLSDFIRSYMDFLMEDQEVRDLVLNQVGASMELYAQNEGGAEEGYDQMVQDVQESVDQICNSLTDVNMMVYVDGKGRMAAWNLDTAFDQEGESVSVTWELRLQGGTYLTQNMTGRLQIQEEANTSTVEMVKTGSFEEGYAENQTEISLVTNEDEMTLNCQNSYDSETGSWDGACSLSTKDQPQMLSVQAYGAVDDLEKGSRISVSVDELLIRAADQEVKLEGSYFYQTAEKSEAPSSLEGDLLHVFTAEEDEWQSAMDEISANFQGILFSVLLQMGS